MDACAGIHYCDFLYNMWNFKDSKLYHIYYDFYLCKDTVIMCGGNCRHVPGNKVPLVKKVIHASDIISNCFSLLHQ